VPHLALRWLGAPQIELDGAPATVERRKTVALLAYLSLTPYPQQRDQLVAFFWPDHTPRRAYAYLRHALWEINSTLGADWLTADRDTIDLRRDHALRIDVDQFHTLLADRAANPIGPLAEAVALYRGDFLAGFTLRDSPDFDAWQSAHTEHLRRQFSLALEHLTQAYAAHGEFDTAIATAHKWLLLDSLNEVAHRELMRLYARVGQRSTALRQFERCVNALRAELGVEPEAATQTLFDQIRTGTVVTTARSAVPSPPASSPIDQFPAQGTPFVGRESELAGIARLLARPDCRLLTLVGPGGIGKTRLAIQTARGHATDFRHGAHFIDLSAVPASDGLPAAIVAALRLPAGDDVWHTVLDYAREKQQLLVLDNFEQLIDGALLLSELLATASQLKLIVTSRERLNVPEEWVLPIEGLTYPQDDRASALEAYSAIELFTQHAQRANATFVLDDAAKPHVSHICQMLEGMPLGVMLAAAWVKMLSCAEIEHELSRDLDFLAVRSRHVPERHRSLRAVFGHAWQQLSEAERVAFQQLTVFQGGFRAEAAAQVTGASLHVLAQLVDKSLVRRDAAGRYDLHEMVKQYAAEKLAVDAAEADRVRGWHSAYYLDVVCDRDADLKGPHQLGTLNYLRAEGENVRAAWLWAVEHRQVERLLRVAPVLHRLDVWANAIRAFDALVRSTLAAVRQWAAMSTAADGDEQTRTLLALLMTYVAIHDMDALARTLERTPQLVRDSLVLIQTLPDSLSKAEVLAHVLWASANEDPVQAEALYHQGRAIRVAAAEPWLIAEIDLIWANVLGPQAAAQAGPLYQRSLEFFTTCGDRISASDCLGGLARLHDWAGDAVEAARLWRERLAIAQARHDAFTELMMWAVLGRQATRLGDYDEARFDHHQSLAIVRHLGHLRMTADQLNDLARAEVLNGEFDQAEQHAAQSLQLLAKVGDPTGLVEAYVILGDGALARRQLAQAHQHYQAALDSANALPPDDYALPSCRALALTGLGKVSGALGYGEAARGYLREAIGFIPQLPLQWQSDGMDTLSAVAQLIMGDRPLCAVELLAFVSARSQTYQHVRVQARSLLNELADRLPPADRAAAQQHGQDRSLDAITALAQAELGPGHGLVHGF